MSFINEDIVMIFFDFLSINDVRKLSTINKEFNSYTNVFIKKYLIKESSIIFIQYKIRQFLFYKRTLNQLIEFDKFDNTNDDYHDKIFEFIKRNVSKISKDLRKNSIKLKNELKMIILFGNLSIQYTDPVPISVYVFYTELRELFNKWFININNNVIENYF